MVMAHVTGTGMAMVQASRPDTSYGRLLTKAFCIGLTVIGLALLLAAQAVSGALAKKSPPLAAMVYPANGFAWQELAGLKFKIEAVSAATIASGAQAAAPDALQAYRLEPLSAESLALIGLAKSDPIQHDAIMLGAGKINQRNLTLQGNLLNLYLARDDFPQTIHQLNTILRVRPSMKADILPVLVPALQDDRAVPALAQTLNQGTEWTNDYLRLASANPPALSNLLALRQSLTPDAGVNSETDRLILHGLIGARRYAEAYRAYVNLAGINNAAKPETLPNTLGWRNAYLPFDWRLADSPGFRAFSDSAEQGMPAPQKAQGTLDFSIARGEGGVLAERMIRRPPGPFAVTLDYAMQPAGRGDNVRLEILCADPSQRILDVMTKPGRKTYAVGAMPKNCQFVRLRIHARAWSRDGPITGAIKQIVLSRQ